MPNLRLGLVGVGKIARDEHFPAIDATEGIALAAVASRTASLDGVPSFSTLTDMLNGAELDAVALCTPPQARYALALEAIRAGKHVLLEKPPGASLSEVEDLVSAARAAGVTLFATWHSRFSAATEPARSFLDGKTVTRATITWKEDVRRWHPGQEWIWEPGGLGIFDPGINALSIATAIWPQPFFLRSGTLEFPANKQAPIAADLSFTNGSGLDLKAVFDWRQEGEQTWTIEAETADGHRLTLTEGGRYLDIDGLRQVAATGALANEYRGIYAHFVELVESGTSDVDVSPLRHVADAFMLGRREVVEAFHEIEVEPV